MKNITANAIEILQQVMQQRNWHQHRIERRLAATTKQNLLAGKLSYEKASAILETLGWQKIQEETWRQLSEEERLQNAAGRTGEENLARGTKLIKAIYSDPEKPVEKKIHFGSKKDIKQLRDIAKKQPKK